MAKTVGRLSDRTCRTVGVGTHHDGLGLYLQVRSGAESLTKSWLLRYSLDGRSRWAGLGPYPIVSLARAREKALDARRLLADGGDPIAHKHAARAALRQRRALPAVTFDQAAAEYVSAHRSGWRAIRHAQQWERSLREYVSPIIGHMPVGEIDTDAVMLVLRPLWMRAPETASRVRGRIELILAAATARGLRSGDNCARWRGHLDKLLPAPGKVRPTTHFRSMAYADVPGFMSLARARDRISHCIPLRDLDGQSARRGDWREVGRDRPDRSGVDDPGRKNEGWARAPGAVEPAGN
jgi:hypothetical protein